MITLYTNAGQVIPRENSSQKEVTDDLRFRRKFTDAKAAWEAHKKAVEDSKERAEKMRKIAELDNCEPPFNQSKLKAAEQDWRFNFSTGFFPAIKRRVKPSYTQIITEAKSLTQSRLAEETDEAKQKTRDFQEAITRHLRGWADWDAFVEQVVDEDLLYGYAAEISTDPYDWKPIFCRQDEVYFPAGCGQNATAVPIFSYIQRFRIDELADKLIDPETSKLAGWNIANLVKCINKAKYDNRLGTAIENQREVADLVRESNYGTTQKSGVKIVKAVHIFVLEANKKVTHYLVDHENGDTMFEALDQFASMEDVLSLFTLEVGDGKLHGSKGLGRILYNISTAAEKSRNLAFDNGYLAGLLLVKKANKTASGNPLQIRAPLAVINDGWEVIKERFETTPEAFVQVDRFMTQLAEAAVGAFLSGNDLSSAGGEKSTAAEVNYVASLEAQIRQGILRRFYQQFMKVVQKAQRRICANDYIKAAFEIFTYEQQTGRQFMTQTKADFVQDSQGPEAVVGVPIVDETGYGHDCIALLVELMRKGLTPLDLFELRESSTISTFDEAFDNNDQGLTNVVGKYAGNPNVDQMKLIEADISKDIGYHKAKEFIIPNADGTLQAEQTRLQLMETLSMLQGEPMMVSPRDAHTIHMDVIMAKTKEMAQNLTSKAPDEAKVLVKNILDHFLSHIDAEKAKGTKPDVLKPYEQWVEKTQGLIQGAGAPTQLPDGVQPAAVTPQGEPNMSAQDAPMYQQAQDLLTNNPQPINPEVSKPFSQAPMDLKPNII